MKTAGLKRGNLGLVYLGLLLASAFVCRAAEENGYKPILHPSIFWHNNQWETYENGLWVPYRGSTGNRMVFEAEPLEAVLPEPLPGPDMVDTNIYVPPYGWGFIGAPAVYPLNHRHGRAQFRREHQRPVTGLGQRNAGPGRTAIGIGRANVGVGKTTIGIGRPNAGIGQPNVGIGQPNVGIGQTTIGIGQPNADMGQPNAGIGRTTIGIGQPNAGVGQPTISVGQPNVGIGQPTIGIGQPMSGGHSEQFRGR